MYANPPHQDNLPAIKSDGTPVTPAVGQGCTLASGTTYVFVLGDEKSIGVVPLAGATIKWDASIVITSINIETTDFARKIGRPDLVGADDLTDFDVTTKGGWMRQDPSANVYITVTSTDGTTGGATVTNSTVAVVGGTQGAANYQLGNLGARRCRLKVVVGGTGGVVRVGMNGKAGIR